MSTIDEIVDAAVTVGKKRDLRLIETEQAIAAAQSAFTEIAQDENAEQILADAVADLKDKAAAYGSDDAVTLADVLDAAKLAVSANGEHVIEHQQMLDSIDAKIREQAEADTANVDEDDAIDELKQLVNEYTKEE